MNKIEIKKEMLDFLNNRTDKFAHKGAFGKAFLICGSVGMSGAAILAAKAAVKCETGLTTLSTVKSNYTAVACVLPEVMQLPMEESSTGTISKENAKVIAEKCGQSDAVLYGPGVRMDTNSSVMIKSVLQSDCQNILLDADGINSMDGCIDILCNTHKNIILTPHIMEMERLTGWTAEIIEKNRTEIALQTAKQSGATIVMKGHHTLIASPSGNLFINKTGNAGLAKGGSGDVLSGMIVSFLAQGFSTTDSAIAGVYLHGRSADIAALDKTKNCLLPSDLIEYLPKAFKEVLQS